MVLIVIVLFSAGRAAAVYSETQPPFQNPSVTVQQFDTAGYLEQHGFQRVSATQPLIHYSAESWKKALLPAIRNARTSICIVMYLANRNEFNAEIYDALKEKADQGVRVYFMFDPSSYQRILHNPQWNPEIVPPSSVFRGSKVLWAEVGPFRMERLMALPWLLLRDHRKIVLIDGEHVFAGGFNINVYSFAPLDLSGNVDAMVEFHSLEAGRYLARSFAESWNRWSVSQVTQEMLVPEAPGGSVETMKAAETTEATDHSGKQVSLWLVDQQVDRQSLQEGAQGISPIDAMFKAVFRSADSEIWLVQALGIMAAPQMQLIREAIQRGVKVNLMLSENQFAYNMDKAVRYKVLPLIDAGVHVYMYKSEGNALLHYKMAMADGRLVALGSANFNPRSQYLSNEVAIVADDEYTVAAVKRNLEELLQRSRRITREEAATWRGFVNFIYYLITIPGG